MRPLHLLGDIQARVQDYLVQVPHLICEPRLAIAALLGCAKLVLKERVVLRADNGKVVAHCADARSICEAALFPFPLFSQEFLVPALSWPHRGGAVVFTKAERPRSPSR